jgi:hypothetical protein
LLHIDDSHGDNIMPLPLANANSGRLILTRWLPAALLLVVTRNSPSLGQGIHETPTKSLAVDELSNAKVVGRLGQPLGTIVTIEGVYDVPKKITKSFGFTMVINSVNGKELKTSVAFERHTWEPYLDQYKAVRGGNAFRLVGYETGAYSGYIPGEEKYDSRYATYQRAGDRWGFHPRFHVIAISSSDNNRASDADDVK